MRRASHAEVERVHGELRAAQETISKLVDEKKDLVEARDRAQRNKELAEQRASSLADDVTFRDTKISELNEAKKTLENSLSLERASLKGMDMLVKNLNEELSTLRNEKLKIQEDLTNHFYYTWLVSFRCARHVDPNLDWSKVEEALEAGIGEISPPGEVLPPVLADFFNPSSEDQMTVQTEAMGNVEVPLETGI